jgi:hypothetical protein
MSEKPDKPPWSPRLQLWLSESWDEAGCSGDPSGYSRDFAILPNRLFELIGSLSKKKKYDFCFIGSFSIRPAVAEARQWIIPFILRAFGSRSFLQFTDSVTRQDHRPFGPYDQTKNRIGFVPREMPMDQRGHLDPDYYSIMCQSQFALCPAGDAPWSMRFYEAMACRAIPVVNSISEAARTPQEASLGYKFLTTVDDFVYSQDWAEHNFRILLERHTLCRNGIDTKPLTPC